MVASHFLLLNTDKSGTFIKREQAPIRLLMSECSIQSLSFMLRLIGGKRTIKWFTEDGPHSYFFKQALHKDGLGSAEGAL